VFVGIGALMPVAGLTGFLRMGRVERLKLDAAPVIPARD
jgi:hypothetical protein